MSAISSPSSNVEMRGGVSDSLPTEKRYDNLWCLVAKYLSPKDLQSLAVVSKTMQSYILTILKTRSCDKIQPFVKELLVRLNPQTEVLLIKRLQKILETPCPNVSHLAALKDVILAQRDEVIQALQFVASPGDIVARMQISKCGGFFRALNALHTIKGIVGPPSEGQLVQNCKKLIDVRAFGQALTSIHRIANVSLKTDATLALFHAIVVNNWYFSQSSVLIDEIEGCEQRDIALATFAGISRDLRDFHLEKRAISLMAPIAETDLSHTATNFKKRDELRKHFQSLLAHEALREVEELIDWLPEEEGMESFEKIDAIEMYADYLRIQGNGDRAIQMLVQAKPNRRKGLFLQQLARKFSLSGEHEKSLRCAQAARESRRQSLESSFWFSEECIAIDDRIFADSAKSALFSGQIEEFFCIISKIGAPSLIDEIFFEMCQIPLIKQDWESLSEIANRMAASFVRDEIFRLSALHFLAMDQRLHAIQQANRIQSIWIRDPVLRGIFKDPLLWEFSDLIEALSQISDPVSKGNMAQNAIQAFLRIKDWDRATLFIRKFFDLRAQISGYLDLIRALIEQQEFSLALDLIEGHLLENAVKGSWARVRLRQERIQILLKVGRLQEAFLAIDALPCSSLHTEMLMDFVNILLQMDQKAEARKILERVTKFFKMHPYLKGRRYDQDWKRVIEAQLILGEADPVQEPRPLKRRKLDET